MGCLFFHKWELVATAKAEATCDSLLLRQTWQETVLFEFEKCTKCGERRTLSEKRGAFATAGGREIQLMWEKSNMLPNGIVPKLKET